jgi:hypothetical protein
MAEHPVNVGNAERLAAGVLAGALLASVIRKPAPLRIFALGCLLYRAFSGHCYGYEWCGLSSCKGES